MTTPLPEAKTRLEMPFLLLCGMGFLAFFVSLGTVVYTVLALGSFFGHGPFSVNGVQVTKSAYLRATWSFLALYPLVLVPLGAIVYALWRERTWSRPAMMGCWPLLVVGTVIGQFLTPQDVATFASTLIMLLVAWAAAAWYFYRKKGVTAYYRAVAARQAGVGPTNSKSATASGA